MSTGETGKSRSNRIPTDYYKQPDKLDSWRRLAVIAGLLAAIAYVAYAVTWNENRQTSTGPISRAHASFESNCELCHSSELGASIGSDAWRLFKDASVSHIESACQQCHTVSGHFRELLVDDSLDRDCSRCHREHHGRDHDIGQVSNDRCVDCHGNLKSVCLSPNAARIEASVSAFQVGSHPDFPWVGNDDSEDQDPGTVRFNHSLHLLPGIVAQGSRGGMSLRMLSEEWQAKYRDAGQDGASLVELSCGDCHELGSGNFANADTEQIGEYFSPVSFDRHCAGCHAMTYAGQTSDLLPLPHAAPWAELETILHAKIKGGRFTGSIRMPNDQSRGLEVPGRSHSNLAELSQTLQDVELSAVVSRIRMRCLGCHVEEHLDDTAILAARTGSGGSLIPERWLQRARFDHAAHGAVRRLTDSSNGEGRQRGMDCTFCHNVVVGSQTDETAVMIAGIESCTPCHRPADHPMSRALDSNQLGGQPTWASDDCTMCHRYHWSRDRIAEPAEREE